MVTDVTALHIHQVCWPAVQYSTVHVFRSHVRTRFTSKMAAKLCLLLFAKHFVQHCPIRRAITTIHKMHLLQLSDEVLSKVLVRACARPISLFKVAAIMPTSTQALQLVCQRFKKVVHCREFWQQLSVSLSQPRWTNPVVAHWVAKLHLEASALSLCHQPYFSSLLELRVCACKRAWQ